jgi:hypothetical protein
MSPMNSPVTVSFAVAQARLASLARGRELMDASQAAYSRGLAGLLRVGPPGDAEGISRLAAVRFLGPAPIPRPPQQPAAPPPSWFPPGWSSGLRMR